MNHLISLADLSQEDFLALIGSSCAFAEHSKPSTTLSGCSVGIDFRRTSTRTRTSFAAGAARLGAQPILFGPGDLQTNTGESVEDTARVLGSYLVALVIRSAADPEELRRMASVNGLAIVNAMTADEHPTQALSDLAMMKRHFGELAGLRVAYVGEGNNTAAALALACSRIRGLQIDFFCPRAYTVSPAVVQKAQELSARYGGRVCVSNETFEPGPRSGRVNVVYATRWQTTGTSKSDPAWREAFAPYRVSTALMARVLQQGDAVFMHDLPAVRGEDCDAAVLDGPNSIAFEQARQKLFTAMAILEWCATA